MNKRIICLLNNCNYFIFGSGIYAAAVVMVIGMSIKTV